jgi:hypothetical protein
MIGILILNLEAMPMKQEREIKEIKKGGERRYNLDGGKKLYHRF